MAKESLKMALIESISEIASTILQSIDGYLVDVNVRGERDGSIVEVYVDTDKGITADECAQVNRYVSSELEKQNLISGRYRLEVSSPGLDRPLTMVRQYKKNIGRQVKIVTSVDDQKNAVEGVLENVNDATLTLTTNEKQEKSFALNDIREAYVLPQFKKRTG
jgi:ribosome maturation factor RimP